MTYAEYTDEAKALLATLEWLSDPFDEDAKLCPCCGAVQHRWEKGEHDADCWLNRMLKAKPE